MLRKLRGDALERNDSYTHARLGVHLVAALYLIGEPREAQTLLVELLRLGMTTGLFQTFKDGGRAVLAAKPPHGTENRSARALTARELAVLQLIGRGLCNKQIARHLKIMPETVKCHMRYILAKLGARTRAHSVAFATRLGLI